MHQTDKMKECISTDVEKAFENMVYHSKKKNTQEVKNRIKLPQSEK